MSGANLDTDVLVAGAGPTGLTLAGELLRRGLRVRVIDQSEAPTTLSKAIAVHARTLEIAADLGVADQLLARGVKLVGATLWSKTEELAKVDFAGLETPYPFVLSISQAETEGVLTRLLESRGGKVERDTKLVRLREEDGVVHADLVNLKTEATETVRARWLVGCDGAHSIVRKSIGASFEGHPYEDTFVLADVKIDWDVAPDRVTTFFAEDGIAAFFPMLGDRWRVVASAPPGLAAGEEPTLAALEASIAERAGTPAPMSDCAWLTTFRIHCRQVDRYRKGHVFLAGDAAHIHSPAGGQGMNTGMQDAHNLAWKLALVHQGKGRDVLLDSYAIERHAVGAALLRSTDIGTKLGTIKSPTLIGVRNHLAKFLTGFDPVRRKIVESLSELSVAYEYSPINSEHTSPLLAARIGETADGETPTVGTRLAFQTGPAAGARAPDGTVRRGDETVRLSSLWGGTRFTLLLFDGRSSSADGYEDFEQIAKKTRARWGDRVAVFVVTPQKERPAQLSADITVLHDDDSELEQRYAARTECLFLIRPDLYVGFRSQPADGPELAAYLDTLLV
ncbi:MAG: FAD-dependent monooxygenase [Labilithrix sp.]|nr:FAD-dependent monooxygenase [Labilithrix sp.]MCW5812203.1 FAD-dependent monooxygenase [Labilithrix sp.]